MMNPLLWLAGILHPPNSSVTFQWLLLLDGYFPFLSGLDPAPSVPPSFYNSSPPLSSKLKLFITSRSSTWAVNPSLLYDSFVLLFDFSHMYLCLSWHLSLLFS